MIRRWVVLVAGIFCTLISSSVAQVHIKARVEIAPKKINGRMSQEDNATGLPYLSVTKIPQPEDQATIITVLAPCSIQISGTAHIDGDADICAWFSLDGYTSVGTVNENAYCGQTICIDMAEGSCCTGFPIVNPTITQTPTSITGHVDAQWCCIYPRFVHVTWDFQVTAIPNGSISADSLSMSAYPNLIDACDMSPYTSPISAAIVNAAGIPIDYCGSIPVQFTIDNPIAGLSLNGKGTSTTVNAYEGVANTTLWWDGSDLPNDEYTVQVRAEANGLSAEQQVSLRKVVPCYFSVLPSNNSISMGQADSVTVIAMDHNGNEMLLDGNKLVTLLDWTGGGSFIVGSDTLQGQATVTYDKARNGSVKYFILDTLNLIDEKYHTIDVYRTDYPERNGYGYIDVMPACPVVSLSKPKISPGDKATVSIKAQTEQGTFSYPAGQLFIVSMDADARYGTLHCAGSSGTTITGTQPFKFIAADSIDVDSVVVHISASPVSGATYSIMNGQKDTLQGHTGSMSMKQIHPPGKKPGLNIEGTKNILVSPQETMTEKLTEQNSVISQKAAKKQALMNAITEAIKTRAAGKSDAVSAKQLNAMVQDLAEGDQCTQSASVTIKKETQFTGFSQNDLRWSGKPYNSINATIGDVGCALCNMASILVLLGYDDVTPLTLNTWMLNNHGKNYDYYKEDGGVNWQTVTDYATKHAFPYIISDPINNNAGQLHADKNNIGKLLGTPINLDIVDTYLNNGYYIVAEVKNIHDDGTERTHFVRLESKDNGTYNIYDPGHSNRTTLSSYNNQIYKAIYYIVYK